VRFALPAQQKKRGRIPAVLYRIGNRVRLPRFADIGNTPGLQFPTPSGPAQVQQLYSGAVSPALSGPHLMQLNTRCR
jgi:hypothetical protein